MENLPNNPAAPKSSLLTIGTKVLLGIFCGGIVLLTVYFLIRPSHQTKPATTLNTTVAQTVPTAIPTSAIAAVEKNLESCSLSQKGNSLVRYLKKFKNGLNGNFVGTITDVQYTSKTLVSIQLTSDDNTQKETFDVTQEKARLLQYGHASIEMSKDLRTGIKGMVSFMCSPKTGNVFLVTYIGSAKD